MRAVDTLTKKELKSIIVGTLLGDSSLSGKKNKHIAMGHCAAQKEYLDWKVSCLNKYIKVGNLFKERPENHGGIKRQVFYKFYSTSHHKLTAIYNLLYINGKKCITQEALNCLDDSGLAALFMDDGCKDTQLIKEKNLRVIRSFTLSLCGFSLNDVLLLSSWILNKFNISSKVYLSRKKYPILKITTKENRDKFVKVVEPFLLDCVRYKIQC